MQAILYSFRRCPYAIRARLALRIAKIDYDLRNILLKEKPADMLKKSAKGTVPVLVLENEVIDESLDIMLWALKQNDPLNLLYNVEESLKLIQQNDTEFKFNLDRYKYPDRYDNNQEHWQAKASVFIQDLENRLTKHLFLLSDNISLADYAIFPFIRQFTMPDKNYLPANFPNTNKWLLKMLDNDCFKQELIKKPLYLNPEKSS